MTRALDRQIETYGRADGPAQQPGKPPGRAAVESEIDIGVSLFDAAKNEVRRWQRDTADWDAPATTEQARAYDRTYRTLHASLLRLVSDVAALEQAGTAPENADRLRAAVAELDVIVSFDLDRLIRADRETRAGRPTRSTDEVKDALRRRVGG